MDVQPPDKRTIFERALDFASGAEREAYLEDACAGNPEMRAQVDSLLKAHNDVGSFLDGPAFDAQRTAPMEPIAEQPGTIIGPYKLLEQIGEGGFGVVYMAEQQRPVRRKVALKVVKPGMDTRQVIARFETERQALAIMDHPNIAKVFDAGATDSGRPYFVMELIKGEPITEFCDRNQLPPRERLELFGQVCHAVQHAHQKGIIHRDIKPTNVLVEMHDTTPVVKVIDFGIAKALGQELTDKTLFTGFAQFLGTPLYMSPEQAGESSLDVDTRSDIYSLGVLLYELLTGATPFDKERFRKAAHDEICRIIREEEPPKPSTRLSESKESLPSISAQRHMEPAKLTRLVRGELDWIVMKALEKDRSRRYETANGLAMDVQRYLNDDAVQACPPSTAYRFRKFARRNKAALFAAIATVTVMLLVIVGLAMSNRLIDEQRQRAERNFTLSRVAVTRILSQAAMGHGDWAKLTPELRKKFANEAIYFYESFLQVESADPSIQYELGVSYRALGELHKPIGDKVAAEKFVRLSIAILDELLAKHPNIPEYRQQLAYSHYALAKLQQEERRFTDAEDSAQRAATLYEGFNSQVLDDNDYFIELAFCYELLTNLQKKRGAQQVAEQSIDRILELLANNSPDSEKAVFDITKLRIRLAAMNRDSGDFVKAIAVINDVLKFAPDSIEALKFRAACYIQKQEYERAIEDYSQAIELLPKDATNFNSLAWLLATVTDPQHRDPVRAVELAKKATELAPGDGRIWNTLGVTQYRAGDWKSSIDALNNGMELRNGGDATDWLFLAMAHWQLGNKEEARQWFDKGAQWMDGKNAKSEAMVRFRHEAAELLRVNEKK